MFKQLKEFFQDIHLLQHNLELMRTQYESPIERAALPQKECAECFSSIDERARRCPHCTTILIA